MDLEETAILGAEIEHHWYSREKRAALLQLAAGLEARRLLDVGAGSGLFARTVLKRTMIEESDRDETARARRSASAEAPRRAPTC